MRPGHAIGLSKSGFDIGDMAQRVAHGHEIRHAVGDRPGLRGSLHQGYAELLSGDGEHRLADIDPYNFVAFASERERLARKQAGTDGDIHHLFTGDETGPFQAGAAVPTGGGEGKPAVDQIIMMRRAIEEIGAKAWRPAG